MKIISNLTGTDDKTLTNANIASDFMTNLDDTIISLSTATCQAINPQLRQVLDSQLVSAINTKHELLDMMVKKSWYSPFDDPTKQLKDSYIDAKRIMETEN
ncbi:spore coat protein [Clostridium felsineum]|uniref:Uncharacterized protein n=1 Tax=Clostridium felsineum TaxID=36839 RepID=A0A1S8KYT2_9CLOT|nr:spore coat protein [Clostridium felsineum]MCR3760758.1 spore coat protein [Clostridium felsineum]URZ03883.1 hypothetical protein CLAUR_039490 [Clostridium felsineum]URZ07841.1 hypothetical protein CLROS_032020 [Clostridium felsineum]URZ12872.1 hypothetical protein CROST_036170 [Clostridium felsineum]